MHNGFFFKGPAGSAAGPAGPQGDAQRRIYGLPHSPLAGYTNGQAAARARRQVAGADQEWPQISYQEACFIEYSARLVSDKLITGLLDIQQCARLPSHISVPYSGTCFERHRGTGSDPGAIGGHPDLPVTLPFVGPAPGAPFTFLVDYEVPQGHNGVIKSIGFDVNPEPARGGIELRALLDGVPVAPFDQRHGSVVPNAEATWFGFAGTIENPNTAICINMFAGNLFTLEARNSFGGGPVDVAAVVCGWEYWPTMQTGDRTIRGTLTDQR